MNIPDLIYDTVLGMDYIDRIEGMISTFINADWRKAYKKRGVVGILTELVSCVVSHNAPTIRVSRHDGHSGIEIERLLKKFGVRLWDRGATSHELYFCVKRRQVKWAEYVLLRAGIPVTSVLKESRNTEWAMRRAGIPIPQGWRKK